MQIDAKTTDKGLTLEIRLDATELAESFSRVFRGYEIRDLITRTIVAESGALAEEIKRQVSIVIANPSITADCKRAVESGLASATAAVRDRLHEAGIKAADNALGHFLGKTFARFKRAMAFEIGMQEMANSVRSPEAELAWIENLEKQAKETESNGAIPENPDFFDRFNGGAP